jgi:phosphoglycolate phosphatase-like HAD superfamily hydrolase
MKKLVIFDIDGTLIDSNEVDGICFIRSIQEEFQVENINNDWESYQEATDRGIFEEIFEASFSRKPSGDEQTKHIVRFVALLAEYHAKQPSMFQEIRGAAALLDRLKHHAEWEVAIATGGWRESALYKLNAARIDINGIPMITSSESKYRDELLRKCIEYSKSVYGVGKFERIVSVGDAIWDLKTAHKLGIGFIRINSSGCNEFHDCHVLMSYTDQDKFMDYLERAEIPGI